MSRVFVSYSRNDEGLVGPVVQLIRATTPWVWQDVRDIQPGERWRDAIDTALARSSVVLVFWCAHARRSREVAREYGDAHANRKRLVPILLDDTPVPEILSEYQWVDLRGLVEASHAPGPRLEDQPPPSPSQGSTSAAEGRPPPVSAPEARKRPLARRRPWAIGVAAAGVVVAIGAVGLFVGGGDGSAPRGGDGGGLPGAPPGAPAWLASPVVWLVAIVIVVAVAMLAIRRRDPSSRTPSRRAGSASGTGGGAGSATRPRPPPAAVHEAAELIKARVAAELEGQGGASGG